MKCAILINQQRDIVLAEALLSTVPNDLTRPTVILTRFNALDEFGWKKKRKSLDVYLNDHAVSMIKDGIDADVIDCTDVSIFKRTLEIFDVCISRGREFFVIKSPCKLNIAISSDCCYMNRLLDSLKYYGERLKIVLDSEHWFSTISEISCDDDVAYTQHSIDKSSFIFCNIMSLYAANIAQIGKTHLRSLLGLDDSSRVAFLSLRSADAALTIHKNHESFFMTTLLTLETLKANGYVIISRRRLGDFDITTRISSPEIKRFDEFLPLIDIEINGGEKIPDMMFAALAACDVVVLPDISSIADTEAALMRKNAIMSIPIGIDEDELFDELYMKKQLSRRFRDYIDSGFFHVSDSRMIVDTINSKNNDVKNNLSQDAFLMKWFTSDDTLFWTHVKAAFVS